MWWTLRAGGSGEPGEAAEGNGAVGKVHLTRTRAIWGGGKNRFPELVFELPAHFTECGQGGRAAPWAALWPDPGRP